MLTISGRLNRVPANTALFAKILDRTQNVPSVIEFEAGQGESLLAIRRLLRDARLTGVEVKTNACAALVKLDIHAVNANLLDYVPLTAWDLVLTKGLLIHIPPAQLKLAYGVLYRPRGATSVLRGTTTQCRRRLNTRPMLGYCSSETLRAR